jgi:hypothetical protein
VANTGYHRFLAAPDGEGFTIDPVKVAADASSTVCLSCVPYATRPVFHRKNAAIRERIFCTLLALVLRKELSGPAPHTRHQPAGVAAHHR